MRSQYIHSWDLFDTLIGRRCGTANNLFEEMGRRLGDPDFPRKRKAAERFFQEQKIEYGIQDIYNNYAVMFKPKELAVYLASLEWTLEVENVFPIRKHIERLHPDDVIISDMYLSEDELRQLLERAGAHIPNHIDVSCYGKHIGNVWEKYRHRIRSHCGDNHNSDILSPRRYGIHTRPAQTELNKYELLLKRHSEDTAYWTRRHRLQNISNERKDRLSLLQIELNAPFLLACCQLLKKYCDENQIGKVNFISRDTYMFQRMFKKLYPEISSEYIFASRECLRFGSDYWFAYFNERLTRDSVIVDLASSLGSLKKALPRLQVGNPRVWTPIFLPGFKVDYEPIQLTYVTTNYDTKINNMFLEMLNYAPHWHVADMVKMSERGIHVGAETDFIFDQIDEYDMRLVQIYNYLFEQMLQDLPKVEIAKPESLITALLPLIDAEGPYLRNLFPNHLRYETRRKKTFTEAE